MNDQDTVDLGVELTLKATRAQREDFSRHAGARRFAYNWCVENNSRLLKARKEGHAVKVPFTPFDNINAFSQWKRSAEAGIDSAGKIGLPWRKEVHQQVFEEGAKDFARGLKVALTNWCERRNGKTKRKVGFPEFHSRHTSKPTFRLRNVDHKRFSVQELGITVPRFGLLRVRESLRPLRRLLRAGGTHEAGLITFATISERDGYWRLSLNVRVTKQKARSKASSCTSPADKWGFIGCDLGIKTLVMAATADGTKAGAFLHAEEIGKKQRAIAALQRRLAIKREASKSHAKAAGLAHRNVGAAERRLRRRLAKRFAAQRNIRNNHLHHLTNLLVGHATGIGLEDLHVSGMMKNHCLARAIASQGWHELVKQLSYKAERSNIPVIFVGRFFPSSKRCNHCLQVKASVPLDERTFECACCGLIADRDLNAAVNLAKEAQKIANASPEERGKDKTPELEGLEVAFGTPRGRSPATQRAVGRSRDGTAKRALRAHADARKGGVDFVNAP